MVGRPDSQQASRQERSAPYSRQLPSAREKGRPGGAVSEAERGKDTTAKHRLFMPA